MKRSKQRFNKIVSLLSLVSSIICILGTFFSNQSQIYLLFLSIGIVCLLLALFSFNKKNTLSYIRLGLAIMLILCVWAQSKHTMVGDVPDDNANTTAASTTIQVQTSSPQDSETDAPNVVPGTIKQLGHYEQDNKEINGTESIEWIALTQDNDEVLIISVLGLNALPYAQAQDYSDWEHSSVREWLNGSFYQNAFSDEEKEGIVLKEIVQHKNNDYPMCDQGENTVDNVFLLSTEEYIEYLYENGNIDVKYRYGIPSKYLKPKVQSEQSNGKYCWWWLRTSSRNNETACSVTAYGVPDNGYHDINFAKGLIRPAMWVDADFFEKLPN